MSKYVLWGAVQQLCDARHCVYFYSACATAIILSFALFLFTLVHPFDTLHETEPSKYGTREHDNVIYSAVIFIIIHFVILWIRMGMPVQTHIFN